MAAAAAGPVPCRQRNDDLCRRAPSSRRRRREGEGRGMPRALCDANGDVTLRLRLLDEHLPVVHARGEARGAE